MMNLLKKIFKNTVNINGVEYPNGQNIRIINNKVFIDGKDVTPDAKNITISIQGDIETLKADACDKVSVIGNVNELTSVSGDISIQGAVGGSVKTTSGNVKCGDISGDVKTVSGNIKNKK